MRRFGPRNARGRRHAWLLRAFGAWRWIAARARYERWARPLRALARWSRLARLAGRAWVRLARAWARSHRWSRLVGAYIRLARLQARVGCKAEWFVWDLINIDFGKRRTR